MTIDGRYFFVLPHTQFRKFCPSKKTLCFFSGRCRTLGLISLTEVGADRAPPGSQTVIYLRSPHGAGVYFVPPTSVLGKRPHHILLFIFFQHLLHFDPHSADLHSGVLLPAAPRGWKGICGTAGALCPCVWQGDYRRPRATALPSLHREDICS